MHILSKFQKINLNHEKKLFLNGSEQGGWNYLADKNNYLYY